MMVKNSRTYAMFRRAFHRDSSPKQPSMKPQLSSSFLGQPVVDVNLCVGCGKCSRDCPSKAITMTEGEGKKHPLFHLDRCLFCYFCAETCPKKAIMPTALFELATTDKSSLLVDPQICTYSIEIQLDQKPQTQSDFGTYKKNTDEGGET
jgi:formate hydrogenlyase subunit 6/NADH:ubiquinone oxidoreductase subunit I